MRLRPRRIYHRFRLQLRRIRRNDQFQLAVLGTLVGVACGYAAIAFRLVIEAIQWMVYHDGGERLYTTALGLPWYWVLLAPAAGGLVVGLFIRYALPGRRPMGVADVMEATALRGGQMPVGRGLLATAVNAASIGAGASVGREGPAILLGATLASWAARTFRLSRSVVMTLVACGVASAVAASFNAPLAGALFAHEVVLRHYQLKSFAPVVIASVAGTVISRSYYGAFPAFIKPTYQIASFWEFPAFGLLGVVSAIAAMAMIASIMVVQKQANRLPGPIWIRPAIAGLAVGGIAIAFPQVLGVGYEATDIALKGGFALWILFALIIAKTAATALSIGSGFGGGVFSPSLFLGAMVGGAFGVIATAVFPDLASARGAYTLVGMGAVAAAVLGAPISTILIVFEMTGDYEVTLAVMVATVISSLICQSVFRYSFFTWQLKERGVDLVDDRALQIMRGVHMRTIMDRNFVAVDAGTTVEAARERLLTAPHGELFVTDAEGHLVGTVTFADLHRPPPESDEGDRPRDFDTMVRKNPPMLLASDTLERAVDVFSKALDAHIAVVEDRDARKMLGVIHQQEVMIAYQRAHLQAQEEEHARPDSRARR